MNDEQIVHLYWQRSEAAISESQRKYTGYCTVIAKNILYSAEDSEECVNDTWFSAWNAIPPARPSRLSVFLGKITRNIAIDRYRNRNLKKHGSGQAEACLDELAECVGTEESTADSIALRDALNSFLHNLSPNKRRVFMLRYWYMYPIKDISRICSMSEGSVKMSLTRTRSALRDYLEREGIEI